MRGKLCGIQACGKQVLFDQPVDRRDADAVAVARAKERPVVRQHNLIALDQEVYDTSKPLTIYDPVNTWKSMTLTDYTMKKLQVPLFKNGERVYDSPSLSDIQKHCREDLATFWDQYKRLLNPHVYKVDLSDSLWMLKNSMLQAAASHRASREEK